MDPIEESLYKKYNVNPATHRLDKERGEFVPITDQANTQPPTVGAGDGAKQTLGNITKGAVQGMFPTITDTVNAGRGVMDFAQGVGNKIAEGPVATVARKATGEMLPTLGSLPLMLKGAQVGARVPGPPLVKGLAGIASGMAAGMGGHEVGSRIQTWLARKLAPDVQKANEEQLAINAEANPVSDVVGGLLPMAAGMKVQPKMVGQAIRGLGQVSRDEATKAAMLNVGLNTGLGVGMQAMSDFDKDKPLFGQSPGKLAGAAIGNMALGGPRSLVAKAARGLGVKPHAAEAPELMTQARQAAETKSPTVNPVPASRESVVEQIKDMLNPASSRKVVLITPGESYAGVALPAGVKVAKVPQGEVLYTDAKPFDVNTVPKEGDFPGDLLGMSQRVKPIETDTVVSTTRDGVEVLTEVVPDTAEAIAKAKEAHAKAVPGGQSIATKAGQVIDERLLTNNKGASANPGQNLDDLPLFKAGYNDTLKKPNLGGEPSAEPMDVKPLETPGDGTDRAGDFMLGREEAALAKTPSPVTARKAGPVSTPVQDRIAATREAGVTGELTEQGVAKGPIKEKLPADLTEPLSEAEMVQEDFDTGKRYQPSAEDKPKITKAWNDFWKKTALSKYLVSTKEKASIKTPSGTQARGSMDPTTREMEIDLGRATQDTQPHEIFHQVTADIKARGTKAERAFIERAEAQLGGEEALTQAVGESFVGRLDKRQDRIVQDMLSFIKYKLGRATNKDLARIGSNIIARGRGGREMGVGDMVGQATPTGGTRYQDNDPSVDNKDYSGGADVKRLISLLRGKQDRGNITSVAGRELIQNSVDAIRSANPDNPFIAAGAKTRDDGNVDISILDNAKGMSPEFLITKFLKMGYSSKGLGEGGGFGIAKGQFLGNAKHFVVRSLWTNPKTGQRLLTEMTGDGESFLNAQEPFKVRPQLGVETEIVPGLKVKTDVYTENSPKAKDGTLVKLTYGEGAGNNWEPMDNIRKTLNFNSDIEGLRLYHGDDTMDSGYNKDNPLLKDLGYLQLDKTDVLNADNNGKQIKGNYKKHETIELPEASVEIFSDGNGKDETTQYVRAPVLSNGVHQFDLSTYLKNEITVPPMVINIKPKVSAHDKTYPFGLDRSSVSDNVKEAIDEFIGGLGAKKYGARLDRFRDALKSAPKFNWPTMENLVLLDTAQKIPAETMNKIKTDKDIKVAVQTLGDINKAVNGFLARRYPGQSYEKSVFRGIFMGTENAYGVRFGKIGDNQAGEIYYDPFLTYEKAVNDSVNKDDYQEIMSRWIGQSVGVSLHENLHQRVNSEGEDLSRALTFTAGELAVAKDALSGGLADQFDALISNKAVYDKLKQYADEVKVYADSEGSSDLLSGVQSGFRDQARATKAEPTKRYQEANAGDGEPAQERKAPRPKFDSAVNALRRANDKDLNKIGDALNTAFYNRREYLGEYERPVVEALDKLSDDELKAFNDYVIKSEATEDLTPIEGSSALSNAVQSYRDMYKAIGQERIKLGMKVTDRKGRERDGGLDPTGMPHLIDPDVRQVLKTQQGTPEWNKLRDEFTAHNTALKVDPEVIDATFKKYAGATPSKNDQANDPFFQALRRSELTKLPASWIDKNPKRWWEKYVQRVAGDMAMFKNVESVPGLAELAGVKDNTLNPSVNSMGGHPLVIEAMEAFNPRPEESRTISKAVQNVSNLGTVAIVANPVTRTGDLVSTPFRSLGLVEPLDIPEALVKAFGNMAGAKDRASSTGFIRPMANHIENVVGVTDNMNKVLRKAMIGWSKGTLSEAIENASRSVAQAFGESVASIQAVNALKGDKTAIRFMDNIGGDWRTLAETPDGMKKLGSRVGLIVQGTYDGSNLPDWAMKGGAKPFMSLARWSIEQQNNFKKYQLDPLLKDGNAGPLISHLIMTGLGGLAVKEVRDLLSGRKSFTPTFSEIKNAPDKKRANEALAGKLGNYAQLMSTFGFMGDMLLANMQAASGQPVNEVGNPAVNLINDVTRHASGAIRGLADGEDFDKVMTKFITELGASHVSMARLARNWWDKAGVTEAGKERATAKDARRDYSVFKRLNGETIRPFAPIAGYHNISEKEFDTAPVGEAVGLVSERMGEMLQGDLGDVPKKLRSLRSLGNTGESPSVTRDMPGFMKYVEFVRKTQGNEAANKLMNRSVTKEMERGIKRQMVPSVSGR